MLQDRQGEADRRNSMFQRNRVSQAGLAVPELEKRSTREERQRAMPSANTEERRRIGSISWLSSIEPRNDAKASTVHRYSWFSIFHGNETTSPPARVPSAFHVLISMPDENHRTEPSAIAAFTPPGW